MYRFICLVLFVTFSFKGFSQQKKWPLNKNSVIKDSSGRQYEFEEWKAMLESRDYVAVAVDTTNVNTTFVLQRVSDERREKWLENSPKPKESGFFTTGKKFPSFKAKTIEGSRINTKDMRGKILVINYWFIDCMPCRQEIPELNKLVKRFEGDTSIVFISIAKDAKYDLNKFVKATPFAYEIIADNVGGNGITTFPTNVVVDQQGNVAFHSSGYSSFAVYWMRKAIEGLKNSKPIQDKQL